MTRLYVANCQQQNHSLLYRLPERKDLIPQLIPIGGQIQLSGDLGPRDVDYFLEQHTPYGLIRADDFHRRMNYVPLIYSTDRPVKPERIAEIVEHNEQVLVTRGQRIRTEAAVAVNGAIERDLFERRDGSQLKTLEMSVVEENRDARDPSPEVAEGVRVTREAEIGSAKLAQRHGTNRRSRRSKAPELPVPPSVGNTVGNA